MRFLITWIMVLFITVCGSYAASTDTVKISIQYGRTQTYSIYIASYNVATYSLAASSYSIINNVASPVNADWCLTNVVQPALDNFINWYYRYCYNTKRSSYFNSVNENFTQVDKFAK